MLTGFDFTRNPAHFQKGLSISPSGSRATPDEIEQLSPRDEAQRSNSFF